MGYTQNRDRLVATGLVSPDDVDRRVGCTRGCSARTSAGANPWRCLGRCIPDGEALARLAAGLRDGLWLEWPCALASAQRPRRSSKCWRSSLSPQCLNRFAARRMGSTTRCGHCSVAATDHVSRSRAAPVCGRAWFGIWAARPVGVDVSADMLRYARDRLPVTRGFAERLPFASSTLPAVVTVMARPTGPFCAALACRPTASANACFQAVLVADVDKRARAFSGFRSIPSRASAARAKVSTDASPGLPRFAHTSANLWWAMTVTCALAPSTAD